MKYTLDLSLFGDAGYRFNDNITEVMRADELARYLFAEAERMMSVNEAEVAYGILRELLWRYPYHSGIAWRLLATCAQEMGLDNEADAATRNSETLMKSA